MTIAGWVLGAFLSVVPTIDDHADMHAEMLMLAQAPAAPARPADKAAPARGAGRDGAAESPGCGGPKEPPRNDGPDGAGPGAGPGLPPGPGAGLPPYLAGLRLTEAQEDKVFELLHAQAPQARLQARELRKAQEELRHLPRAASYDDARAAALADTAARTAAALALARVRTDAAIWQLLTPEQRKQAEERQGPPPGQPGPRGPRGDGPQDGGRGGPDGGCPAPAKAPR